MPGMTQPHSGPARLRVRCWGTRGSLPSPGRHTVHYGGNTSCVEVQCADGRSLIFDAGSGIRALGERLVTQGDVVRPFDLFLTHFHWDHIQGLPFFGPLYDSRTQLTIHGAPQNGQGVQELIAGQMRPAYFPVPFERLAASVRFRDIGADPYRAGDVEVTALRVRHPVSTFGYRIRCGATAIAYIPDNELVGGTYALPGGWYDELCAFVEGADLLLHDAMYLDGEYARVEGWGHSAVSHAVQLAVDARVRRLHLFHHAPERTDAQLLRVVEQLRNQLAESGTPLKVDAAAEGHDILIEERVP